MAVTQNQYTGNGNTVLFSFTFPYLAVTDVKVKINGVTQATTEYSLANATTVQMNSAPANGAVVLVFRDTDNDNKQATFYPGSAIKAEDLNNNIDQILYTAQEVDNNAMSTTGDDAMTGDLNLGGNKVTNMGAPSSGTDGVNKTTLDSTIDTALESDVLVGTDLSKSASGGQVTISHNVTGANTTINNSNGNVIQDIAISAQGHVTSASSTNLDNRYYTETELNAGQLDNRYFTETELSGGQLNNLYYTETELDGGQLDNRYFTETELNNGQLDNRYFTEAELNNGQLDTRYFRQDSSETITSGATWSGSDNFIATTGAIDARIVDLVDDVGGFVPINNETSFPATNPDVNNGTGTLVSIKSISSARTPSGGSVVITDGAGSGNDVTITGLGTTVLPAGYGVIVETTGTTHTYAFHRLSPDATSVTAVSAIPNEIATVAGISTHVQTVSGINNDVQVVSANNSNVTTVAGSITNVNTAASNLDQIQNFANVYRIVSSDPTTSLNAGDLIFNTTSNLFKVYNGSAWVDGVSSVGAYGDNTKLTFGDGNDLEIFHNGSHSKIRDIGTGNLYIESVDGNIYLRVNDNEQGVTVVENGGVELYYDGAQKLRTVSGGISVTGYGSFSGLLMANAGTYVPDGQSAYVGTGLDLRIYHNGTNSYIDNNTGDLIIGSGGTLRLVNADNTESYQKCISNGAVELYFDNSKKFETDSNGVTVTGRIISLDSGANGIQSRATNTQGTDTNKAFKVRNNSNTDVFSVSYQGNVFLPDNNKINFGDSSDLLIYHDGTSNIITSVNGNLFIQAATGENGITVLQNGAVEIYYDNVKKFETASFGVRASDSIYCDEHILIDNDTGRIKLGTAADLQIYHNGSHSYIDETGTGNLYIKSSALWLRSSGNGGVQNLDGSENYIQWHTDGNVELYHDGTKKFETTASGVKIQDTCEVTSAAGTESIIRLNEGTTTNGFAIKQTATEALIQTSASQPVNIKGQAGSGSNSYLGFWTRDTERLRITQTGDVSINNDSGKFTCGTGDDLQIYHDGSNSYIADVGTGELRLRGTTIRLTDHNGTENFANFIDNGAVELYYDNSKKFETKTGGVEVTNANGVADITVKSTGSNRADVRILATGTGSAHLFMDASNGDLSGADYAFIQQNNSGLDLEIGNYANDVIIKNRDGSIGSGGLNTAIHCHENGAVELYYDNNKKIETTNTGVAVTGNVAVSSGNGIDFSSTADGGNGTGRAELLDDYEEGSWTFGLSGGTGSENYSSAARYTKIGRMVHLNWHDNVQRSNVGNSGNMIVNTSSFSLPFTPISGTRVAYSFPHRNSNWAGEVDGKGLMFELYNSTLQVGIVGDTNSYNSPIQQNATIASSAATSMPMSLSLTYYTSS